MKLFFIPDACSLACHIILREIGLPFELVRVSSKLQRTSEGQNYPDINPKGYVPALLLDDGDVLTECCVILQHLAALRPEANLIAPSGSREHLRMQELLTFIGMEIHGAFEPFFMAGMPDDAKELFRRRIRRRYDQVTAMLGGGLTLVGTRYSIVDAYLFTFLRWSSWFDIDLGAWPRLTDFASQIGDRIAVREALAAEAATAPLT